MTRAGFERSARSRARRAIESLPARARPPRSTATASESERPSFFRTKAFRWISRLISIAPRASPILEASLPGSPTRSRIPSVESAVPSSCFERKLVGESGDEPYTGLVLREVDRLTGLVEQLLELGSRGSLRTEVFNVHEAIEHVLSLLRPEAAEVHVSLVRLFDPSLPPVEGHRDSLVQVFLNLVGNAIQAVASRRSDGLREVRIRTRLEFGYHRKAPHSPSAPRVRYLRIDVEDTGPGIPEEHRQSLFSPFFTTKPKGTGLGLAVSLRIATDHGGTIRFENPPGKTVFHVILPVAAKPEA